MENVLPFIGIGLLTLACPIGMVAIGGVGWLVARARGRKTEFSASCMQHGDHPQAAAHAEGALGDQVTQLQAEVESLRARLQGTGISTDPQRP